MGVLLVECWLRLEIFRDGRKAVLSGVGRWGAECVGFNETDCRLGTFPTQILYAPAVLGKEIGSGFRGFFRESWLRESMYSP